MLTRRKIVERRLDMRHTAKSALENVKLGEVVESPGYASEPHDLSASRAKRWPYRVSAKAFVTHGQSSHLGCDVPNLTPMVLQVLAPAEKNLRFSDKHLFSCASGIQNQGPLASA
jgi:hypothetical protein